MDLALAVNMELHLLGRYLTSENFPGCPVHDRPSVLTGNYDKPKNYQEKAREQTTEEQREKKRN